MTVIGRSDVKETVFWTNYFYNCEKVRREHLEDLLSTSVVSTLSSPPEDPPPEGPVSTRDEQNVSRNSSQNSLVPADDSSSQAVDTSQDDASSFVEVSRAGIASPPCSSMSVEDLVLISKNISANK